VKLTYDKDYWDDYYEGPYADTFSYGFNLKGIIYSCWKPLFKELPTSFLDIGCGPGHTLQVADGLFPNAHIKGIEIQEIPANEIVHPGVKIANFMEVSSSLEPVDFVYASCSMYIPWEEQEEFIGEVLRLAKKAVCFANIYLTDRDAIPNDILRQVIYKDAASFAKAIEATGSFKKSTTGSYDFFYRLSK